MALDKAEIPLAGINRYEHRSKTVTLRTESFCALLWKNEATRRKESEICHLEVFGSATETFQSGGGEKDELVQKCFVQLNIILVGFF